MKTSILIILLSLSLPSLYAQDYIGMGKEALVKELQNSRRSDRQVALSDTVVQYIALDHLGARISGAEQIEVDFYFGRFGTGCDSMVMNFHSDSAAALHLSELKKNKKRKWQESSEYLYISPQVYTEFWRVGVEYVSTARIRVERFPGQQISTRLTLFIAPMRRHIWEKFKQKK